MKKTDQFFKKLVSDLEKSSNAATASGFYSPFVAVKINGRGIITEIIFQNAIYNNFTYQHILESSIRKFFSLPEETLSTLALPARTTNLPDLLNIKCSYLSKNVFEKFEDMYEFHSTIPYSTLYLRKILGYGIFGIIRLSPVAPRMSNIRSIPLIFLDKTGRIKGVNNSFLKYFSSSGATKNLVESPVEQYVSDNPLYLLKCNSDECTRDLQENWKGKGRMEKIIETGDIKSFKGRWRWRPSQKNHRLLQLKTPLDFKAFDFKLVITFTLVRGGLPIVVFNSSRFKGNFFPDYNGYLMGHFPDSGFFRMKKRGDVIYESEAPEFFTPGDYTVTVIKRANRFAYFLNDRLKIGFRDTDPIAHSKGYQYIYCREDSELVIKSLKVNTLPVKPDPSGEFNEAALLNGTQNTFRFYQIVDAATFHGFKFYYGLLFYDISHLKQDIRFLEKETEKTKQERDRYKSLALGALSDQKVLVGNAPAVQTIRDNARVAANSPAAILIEGETGTGKEVLAQFIHNNSPYLQGPFVKVDCAALPETLLESELFGYEKGAFTGADQPRGGRLEAAEKGTLFLDEIGNLSRTTQAKLLSFLQDFTLTRLGSSKKIKVKTRIIAATNRPLKHLVKKGVFRSDLMYRLNTVNFTLPPLREHPEDIPLLCSHFIEIYNKKLKKNVSDFSSGGYRKLMGYHWPGNVRELENAVQRAVLYSEKRIIQTDQVDLPAGGRHREEDIKLRTIPQGDARSLRPEHMAALLIKHNGIVKRAAKEAGVARSTFYRKLKEFNISSYK